MHTKNNYFKHSYIFRGIGPLNVYYKGNKEQDNYRGESKKLIHLIREELESLKEKDT